MLGRMALQNESETERKKVIERLAGSSLSSFQLDHYEVVNASDIDQDLIIRFKFSAEHYANLRG